MIAPWLIGLLFLVQAAAVAIGGWVLPHPPLPDLANRLLSWDGRIYEYISVVGYHWAPPIVPGRTESIAFFPGQPLIDHAIDLAAHATSPYFIILESLCTGWLSIILFERLARRLLPPEAAGLATIIFTFWPASCFYTMGYPTGLISICIIAALGDHLSRREWRAAGWLGLGSGVAPTIVFVGFAIGLVHLLRWEQGRDKARRLPPLIAWSALALAGLIGFIAYQALRFHDPFAFITAQAAWGFVPSPHERFLRLSDRHWYLQQPRACWNEIRAGYHMIAAGMPVAGTAALQSGLQRLVNGVSFVLATIGLIGATFRLPRRALVVAGAGWVVWLGYLWSIVSTNQNMLSVPRLIFPAIALCLGLGALTQRAPPAVRMALIALLVLISGLETAWAAAGLWVT